MKITDKYVFFWGGIYSQWYKSPMIIEGIDYNCCEQYMMHRKALMFGDHAIAEEIMKTSNPKKQKELGRQVQGFNHLEWTIVSQDIVFTANYHKFMQNEMLGDELIETGDRILVEASPYDKIWGIGMSEDDPGIEDPENWKGTNFLGEVLTNVREDIKNL